MAEWKKSLLARLEQLEQRFCQIERQVAEPAVAADTNKLIALSKEQGRLRNIVEKYRQYKKTLTEIQDAAEILKDSSTEKEIKSLAEEEIGQLETEKQRLMEQIQDTVVMAEDQDIDSIIIEIRAGTGGDEAALFAKDLYNMYVKYAESRRWKIESLHFSTTEKGGFREVIFGVKGLAVWAELGYEGGGHRVQRIPETESQGRIHTSAATVAVLAEPEQIDIEIKQSDVKEHVSRSSGPGGQSVNKLNSAVKLEHIPTGITVSMQDEKSQHKNRAKAWRILRSRIYEHHKNIAAAERESERKSMIGTGDRSQKIRTYNYPQNRITDHRINLSLYNLEKIMAGDMSRIIKALQQHDREQRLKNL